MSILSQFFGNSNGGGVKRVFRGNASLSGTSIDIITGYTLTNTAKASLYFSNSYTPAIGSTIDSVLVRGKILNETQIQFVRQANIGSHSIDWEIIEYY